LTGDVFVSYDINMSKSIRRLLSIDWDYFFPEKTNDPHEWPLYDWGHRDGGGFFLNDIWYHRAEGFLANDLPLPGTTGVEKTFWDRFQFTPDCRLYIADSHMHIYNRSVFNGITEAWSYDAHHDAGYTDMTPQQFLDRDQVSCADWTVAYKLVRDIDTKVFYPKWRDWAMEYEKAMILPVERQVDDEAVVDGKFHRIFLCRSGGWTPPWVDENFEAFVKTCPVDKHIMLAEVENRKFDISIAENMVQQMKEFQASAGIKQE
jgi:hypothetical protein